RDDNSFTQLESIFVQLNSKECFIPPQLRRVKEILKRNHILIRNYEASTAVAADEVERVLHDLALREFRSSLAALLEQTGRAVLTPLKILLEKQNLLQRAPQTGDGGSDGTEARVYPFNCFFVH